MSKFKNYAVTAAVLALGVISAANAQAKKGAGLYSEDGVVYERENTFRIFASGSPVKAFAVNKNVLWYATEEAVFEQPMNTKSHKPHRTLGGIPAAGTKAIVVDSRGRVWAAGDNGVAAHDGKAFTSYTAELPSKAATSLAAASNGDVWVGTEEGLARFSNGSWSKFTTAEGLASNKIQALITNSRGELYIGTNRGLTIYNGMEFKNYNSKNTGDNIEWNNIKVLAKEPHTDVIWMADGPRNIVNFDGKKWNRYMEIQEGITSIMNDTRRTWFGHENGMLRFNGEEWVSDPKMHGVPAEQVWAIQRDANGDFWIAMEKGVMHFNNPYNRR